MLSRLTEHQTSLLGVWVTQTPEGWKGERVLRNLLLFHNPDAQSSVWATPPANDSSSSITGLESRSESRANSISSPHRSRGVNVENVWINSTAVSLLFFSRGTSHFHSNWSRVGYQLAIDEQPAEWHKWQL